MAVSSIYSKLSAGPSLTTEAMKKKAQTSTFDSLMKIMDSATASSANTKTHSVTGSAASSNSTSSDSDSDGDNSSSTIDLFA